MPLNGANPRAGFLCRDLIEGKERGGFFPWEGNITLSGDRWI